MRRSQGRVVVLVLVAALVGGAVALAATSGDGKQQAGPRMEVLAGPGVAALVPSHEAGVGGWCLAELRRGREGGEGGDCRAGEASTAAGPFQGPIVEEAGRGLAIIELGKESGSRELIVLVNAQVAAVSAGGYGRIATHASALLPDHLRGAIVELRSLGKWSIPQLPGDHLTAWSRSGKPIPQTFTPGVPLAFEVPSRGWSHGAPAPRGVCAISAQSLPGLAFGNGSVMTEVRPHADLRGREFISCARSYYLLNKTWPLEAYVLLDAAHPGSRPAPLPGMRPLAGHSAVFVGPAPESSELARRIPGAWLLVTKGEGTSQRLAVLKHLHASTRPR